MLAKTNTNISTSKVYGVSLYSQIRTGKQVASTDSRVFSLLIAIWFFQHFCQLQNTADHKRTAGARTVDWLTFYLAPLWLVLQLSINIVNSR